MPVITCDCEVCTSADFRDNRLRTSAMLSYEGKNIVIDSGPDFRQQMLRANVQSLDAIVYTHEHKDHVAGMDDVRAFNYKQRKAISLYGSSRVEEAIKREFHYAFSDSRYPGVPEVEFHTIGMDSFRLLGLVFTPVEVIHFHLPVMGFRIGDFAYITDANYISPAELDKLKGVKVLVLNALRRKVHPSHFNLEQALELVEIIAPEQAWFTHISHLLGLHAQVEEELPRHVKLAYDGLSFDIPYFG